MLTGNLILAGRYRIDREVGRGGMARVYRATDEVLGRTVAVKVLNPDFASDPTFVERFRREARAAARLNHPNVVAVFDTGSDGDLHYIVMEFVEGESLAQVLAAEGPLAPERAAAIAGSIAEALSFAHSNGLVHRDVKPANVMITPTGQVKVMDFGIARLATAHTITQASTVFGTAAYLAPEQAQGQRVDGRADVYALGVVLYEMLAGRVPFRAETALAVASKHVFEQPEPPSAVEPGVPPALEAVAMRALAKDPEDRYQDAAAMADALRTAEPARSANGAAALAAAGAAEAATAPLDDPTATEVMGGSTEVLPPVRPGGGGHAAPRRRPRWLLPAVILVVLAVLLAVVLATALPGGKPDKLASRIGGHSSPAGHATHQPSPQPSAGPFSTASPTTAPSTPPPSPTSATPPGVAEALAAVEAAVSDALDSGGLDDHTANDLTKALDEAQQQFDGGDVDKALEQVSHARDKLAQAVDHGDVAAVVAGPIDNALDQLTLAMSVESPPSGQNDEGGPHDHGPHDHGPGKGHDEGD